MAQRFTKDGQKLGGTINVNTIYGSNTKQPSVAVNIDGSFLIMWASEAYTGGYKVFARIFNNAGIPIGSEIYVSQENFDMSSIGQSKDVAIDERGYYCITWSSYAGYSFSNIYVQIINNQGQKIGSNALVSSNSDSTQNIFPEIASTDDGYFLIIWAKLNKYHMDSGISFRIFHSDNYFSNDETFISEQDSWGDIYYVSSDKDNAFLITYSGQYPPYFQKISKSGEYIGDTIRITYNTNIFEYIPIGSPSDIINNHFILVTNVYQRNDPNIYLQKFNYDLQPIDPLNKVHDDYGSANQKKPLVKFNNKGQSIILWEDKRNGRYDLYAQVYDKNFNRVGNNIQINETNADHWFLDDKKAACFSDGTFVIAFNGYETYSDDNTIYLQLVNIFGEKIGQNKIVKDGNYYNNFDLELNINSDDEILVFWYYQYGAWLRKYNKYLSPLSSEFNFIKYTSPVKFSPLIISVDSAFNILAVWREYNIQNYTYDYKIKGKFFDESGKGTTEIFIIDSTGSYIFNLSCKNDNKNYAVLYKDDYKIYLKRKYNLDKEYNFNNTFYLYGYMPIQLNIVEFMNQKIFITFNSQLEVFGFYINDNKRKTALYKLHTYDFISNYYDEYNGTNSADIFEDKLIFAYESSINGGTGYDIWSNVRKIENINFIKEGFFEPANYDILYPNYPNPFNPKTKIAYELLAYHKVKLAIYNIIGQEVKVLVDKDQEKGLYEVEFDASGLASGIYFYRLEAFNTSVKKMVLIR